MRPSERFNRHAGKMSAMRQVAQGVVRDIDVACVEVCFVCGVHLQRRWGRISTVVSPILVLDEYYVQGCFRAGFAGKNGHCQRVGEIDRDRDPPFASSSKFTSKLVIHPFVEGCLDKGVETQVDRL